MKQTSGVIEAKIETTSGRRWWATHTYVDATYTYIYMHLYVYMCACNNVGKIVPNRCGCKGQKRCAAIVASAAGDCDQIDRSDIQVAST